MSLTLVTPPSGFSVSLTEAKAHLKVETSADDDLINVLIEASSNVVDGANGTMGRALLTQSWELRLHNIFPSEIVVPLPPLSSVTSIKYIDPDGVLQTLSSSVYQVVEGEPAKIVAAYGEVWPTVRPEKDAIRVVFECGYGEAADVPAAIKAAMLLHIGSMYRDREATGSVSLEMRPMGYDALLAPYKVWW